MQSVFHNIKFIIKINTKLAFQVKINVPMSRVKIFNIDTKST